MLIEQITMNDFAKELSSGKKTVIIPFGSVEEHGAHLPLGTDTYHAIALAQRAAEISGVMAAPPLWYGLCRSTSQHPGTIGLSSASLTLLVKDLITSMYYQGLRYFVLLSGHAGGTHMATLLNACDELLETLEEARFAVLSIIDLIKMLPDGLVETPGDSHAGEVETSLMLALKKDLVHGTSPAEFPSFPKFIIARNKLKFWKGGVWGDPSKASARKGEAILEREASLLGELIEELQQFQE